MEQKQRFINLAQSGRFTVSELCEEFGITRKTGHKWLLTQVRGQRSQHKFLIFNHAFKSIKPKNWPRILTHWVWRSCRSVIAMGR